MAEEASGFKVKWSDVPDGEGYFYAYHPAGQLNVRWERGAYRAYVNGSRSVNSWAKLEDAKKAAEATANSLPVI